MLIYSQKVAYIFLDSQIGLFIKKSLFKWDFCEFLIFFWIFVEKYLKKTPKISIDIGTKNYWRKPYCMLKSPSSVASVTVPGSGDWTEIGDGEKGGEVIVEILSGNDRKVSFEWFCVVLGV